MQRGFSLLVETFACALVVIARYRLQSQESKRRSLRVLR